MSLIAASHLVKTYRTEAIEVKALQGVSFDIEAGSFLAFVGPSGSGKTTLLNLVCCLDNLTTGSLERLQSVVGGVFNKADIICLDYNVEYIVQDMEDDKIEHVLNLKAKTASVARQTEDVDKKATVPTKVECYARRDFRSRPLF